MFIAIHNFAGDNGIRGSSESFSSGLHRYSEISGMSCSPNFQHPPSTMIQHSSHRIPLQQVHLHPQAAAAAAIPRVRLSSAYGIVHQQFMELEPRQTSDLPFSGRIAYNPHQGCIDPETMFRRRSTSQMRVPEEDVTVLSIFLPLLYTSFYYSEVSGFLIFCITFLMNLLS